jgi:hypothetical protein
MAFLTRHPSSLHSQQDSMQFLSYFAESPRLPENSVLTVSSATPSLIYKMSRLLTQKLNRLNQLLQEFNNFLVRHS